MADPQMRSLSVTAIFVVGYVLSAVAQNSTPKLNNPATQVAPNLEPPWPVKPPWPVRPATQEETQGKASPTSFPYLGAKPPNPESLSSEELDNLATQVLKELEIRQK